MAVTDIVALLAGSAGGLAGGWLARQHLRHGTHRYADEPASGAAHTWVLPAGLLLGAVIGLGLREWPWPVLLTGIITAPVALTLAAIDLEVHRLPRMITWPSYPALLALLAGCSVATDDWAAYRRALWAGALSWAFYYLLHLVARRRGLGRGDVTLAGLIGLLLGWFGWEAVGLAVYAGFILGGLGAAILLLTRRATRSSRIAFGPAMLAGALLALIIQ